MKKLILLLSLLSLILVFSNSCKNDDDENEPNNDTLVLDNSYTGTLFLLFMNTYPEFEDTTSVPVEVDITGHMVFGIGQLQYSGEDDNGQSKIKRQGELTIAPNGEAFMDNGEVYFAVDENTSLEETFTVWYNQGGTWIQAVNETVTDTWNDGLAFKLMDAQIEGSVVEVSNANGTARWVLYLVPDIQ